tara:strand:- start:1483 stop:1737 length:255 start_codon:yes stop_codon:yes gene_type:complete
VPLYEYHCSECDKAFSVFLSMSETQDVCTKCNSREITKVVNRISDSINGNKYINKAGDVVKSHIEQAKTEIKEEKKRMKREMKK